MDRQLWAGIALIFVTPLAGFFSLRGEMVARFNGIDKRKGLDSRRDRAH
jgi:hypothetical protein